NAMEPSSDRRPLLDAEWLDLPDEACLRWYCWKSKVAERRGVLLLLNGRSEFLEKWDETARDFAALGFDVLSLDWRGQGLSTRPLLGTDKGHIDSFDRYIKDLDVFFEKIVQPNAGGRPVGIVAHSMGGHIALRFMADRSPPVRAAALSAPMIGFRTGPLHRTFVRSIAWAAVRIGLADRYTIGGHPFDPAKEPFDGNVLTSDQERYQVRMDYFEDYPELRVGSVTMGWLDAAFRTVRCMGMAGYLEQIKIPVLIAQGGKEALVDNAAMTEAANRLPNGELKTYPDAKHELFMEKDEIRHPLMNAVDDFFTANGV
ncbi:MAG: alpha/beta hydrolase, partial [Pseudomonadota bacterium]